MRLHRLSMTAFGPFAGTEEVDFDALSGDGLFLFTGPTGAGKSSILDAVCFALYGQVPGVRSPRGLRSDHAAADAVPEVVLDVTLRSRRFRVSRTASFQRPKKRGPGSVDVNATVRLDELCSGAWQTLSTRNEEAGQLIGLLLGLSLAQFCQVALLPQGQFAEFLRSDADRRRALLESLFDTHRFASVERWLVGRRQQTRRALDDVDQALLGVTTRIAEVAGVEVAWSPAAPEGADDWWAALLALACDDRGTRQRRDADACNRYESASALLEEATLLAQAHARRESLLRRQAILAAEAPRHEAAGREIAAARSVAALLPLVADVETAADSLQVARLVAETAGSLLAPALTQIIGIEVDRAVGVAAVGAAATVGRERVASVTADLAATGTDQVRFAGPSGLALPSPATLSAAARLRRAEVGDLEVLCKDEQEAGRLAAALVQLEARLVELDDESRTLGVLLEGVPAEKERLAKARDLSHAAQAALPGAEAASEAAADRARAGAHRDTQRALRLGAADLLRECTDVAQAARETWLAIRQSRLDGMAAELARELADGADCPVCGSLDHPNPALSGPTAVRRADEDAAQSAVTTAELERAEAAAQLAELEVELASAAADAGGDTLVDELTCAAERAAGSVTLLHEQAATSSADVLAVTAFDRECDERLRAHVALAEAWRHAEDQAASLRQQIEAMRGTFDVARGDDPTIAARAERLSRLADDLDVLSGQVETVVGWERRLVASRDRLQRPLVALGLRGAAQALEVSRPEAVIDSLEAECRRHAGDVAAITSQLADHAIAALTQDAPPALEDLRVVVASTEQERTTAATELAVTSRRVEDLIRHGAALRRVLTEREPLAESHRVAEGLATLAEGKSADNRLRMSLSAYVLAARLEQVAASASERLSRMSSGRYRLCHTDQGGNGRVRGGLNLRVLDAWTGIARDPASLSGGETFSASLALALGLADVVSAEAGGTLLDTLFVDEGFGSLDDDTLDEVMSVLDGLRAGGRTVGIVSHVAELRGRVPTQLRVEKGRAGSHIHQEPPDPLTNP